MGDIQKFLFDRRFDRADGFGEDEEEEDTATASSEQSAEPEPEEPPPPPPPMFTTAQMEAAREEGYIGGHTSALNEASMATERMTALALDEVARRLDSLRDSHQIAVDALARDAARLVQFICRKVLPATAEENAIPEITALLADLLPSVLDEPRLVVRVHPDVTDMLRLRLDPVIAQSGYEGRVLITPDTRISTADCRVDWGEGGMERDTGRQWAEIEALIDHHVNGPTPVSRTEKGTETAASDQRAAPERSSLDDLDQEDGSLENGPDIGQDDDTQ
ncbi:flagellar assembly protein FliH [Rhodospirillum sp. A1_3_36]|uniref:FliH/SctL family protein n=1 Tax=Rhodospirillum sp. A1_3_36 TaxID=3391666 RepID=UPI0039A43D7B